MMPPAPGSPPTSARRSSRWEAVALRAAIILLAGLFVYAPVFHGGWIIDDNFEVIENAVVQNPAGLPVIWRGDAGADYLPLKTTVMWLLWRGFGGDPTAYHLVSIILHLGSALLLWRLFSRLGMTHAWLGGLLFAAHPLLVGSVAWVSELKNTLSLSMLLLAMLAWLAFDERRRWWAYALALGWFVAALLCKSSVIMWPVVMLLYAWWKHGRIGWRDVAASLPFFAASLAMGLVTIHRQTLLAIGTEVFPLGGFASRLAVAGLNIAFYFWKTVWPVGLLPMYPQWRINPPPAVDFLPWPILAALFFWLWTRRGTPWGRAALFGLGFFVINLAPVLGFFTMSFMRISWAGDHLAYLSSIGIIGLAAAGAGALYDGLSEKKRPWLSGGGWLGFGLLIVAAHQHAEVYTGMDAMCRYTLAANPNAWLAHQLYSVWLLAHGEPELGYEHAAESVRQKPDVAETQNTLGVALVRKGLIADAIPHYREAIRLAPGVWPIRVNVARCLADTGQFDAALTEYLTLLGYAPDNPVFHCNAGVCLYKVGRIDDAVAELRKALAIDPNLVDARTSLDVALKQRNGDTGQFQTDAPR